ncbi:hypothetical protein SAMN04488025_10181 [Planifilum fulgidum]|jgi:hypothetical protein|uniref:Uncharacterized protein n=1 Tax=Planifilum fulgidum TaxID=201973 RepID=A0A1I2KEP3_9BACL|nr:hypothetical protein SAMN04488025_10181 [Planifilum fulgidum]
MGLGARPAGGDVCGRGDPDRRSLRDLHHPAEMGHAGSGRDRHVMIIPSIALSGIRSRCFFINRKPDLSRPSRRRSYTSPVARHPEHTHGCERRGPGPRSTGMGMALLQRNRHMPIVPPMIMDGVRTAVVHNRMSRDAAYIDAGGWRNTTPAAFQHLWDYHKQTVQRWEWRYSARIQATGNRFSKPEGSVSHCRRRIL